MGQWVDDSGIIPFFKKNMYVILAIAAIAIAAGAMSGYTGQMVALSGYDVNSAELLPQCQQSLSTCQIGLDDAGRFYEQCKTELEQKSSLLRDQSDTDIKLAGCIADKSNLNQRLGDQSSQISALTATSNQCKDNVASVQSSLTSCQSRNENLLTNLTACQVNNTFLMMNATEYNILAQNSANVICCTKKSLGETNLAYFYVLNNSIFCTAFANETNSTKAFSC